ncbi:hypothetical protein [Sporomusa termitida]|uniref:Uncharacterized protein n=1 Tax=Sporomusa termitida TaxID=2377 RepID=A0A517DNT5_9FIRM|nr:hypothetical protein [Sporomusa termitida]QDR79012.1 hypothetical protein SPTER_02640 [Sporomusa termitida]
MPIITCIKDIFAAAKGPYHRNVGRHTQRFCARAAKIAGNEVQRRIFLVAAICADEYMAAVAGVDNQRQVAFPRRQRKKKISKQQMTAALRAYVSAVLVMISTHKEGLLTQAGLTEAELLQAWCEVFEYQPEDMRLFDEVLLPAYRQGGTAGLAAGLAQAVFDQVMAGGEAVGAGESEALQAVLLDDAAAVIRVWQPGSEAAS